MYRKFIPSFFLCMATVSAYATDLRVGQVWSYKTRPSEPQSTLTILRIENYHDLGSVIHIRVDRIKMTNPIKGNIVTDIPHLPFQEQAIQQSITKLSRTDASVPPFEEGYNTWKQAYLQGQAGAFETDLASTLTAMLGAEWKEQK